ncbi:hypothetical protein G7Y79_00014g037270 [Physcia stellaris]|nr:hypothetical protein G7Y79_00014g037270 [Physcia stellaris]
MYADKTERARHHDAVMTKFRDANNGNKDLKYPQALPPIWVDTLCVPVRGEHDKIRTQAISSLRDVYMKAHRVLVIDEDIQQLSLDKVSWKRPLSDRVEVMFRFAMSGWNSRLWTLQEGRLGEDLYLLLKDGVLRAQDLFFRSALEFHRLHSINEEGISLLYTIVMAHHDPSSSQELALGRMILGLRNRQTSRESDETICLTNMLGGDPSELVNTDYEQRMPKFLRSLEGIPPAILFMGEPRLREPGYRWAPTSFLHRRDRCYDTQRLAIKHGYHPAPKRPAGKLLADNSGLQIKCPGILLSQFSTLPDASVFLIDTPLSNPSRFRAMYDRDTSVENISWTVTKTDHNNRTAALIVGGWAMDYHNPIDCVLVAVEDPRRGEIVIRANVICSFQIVEVRDQLQDHELVVPGLDQLATTSGVWYDYEQAWILD